MEYNRDGGDKQLSNMNPGLALSDSLDTPSLYLVSACSFAGQGVGTHLDVVRAHVSCALSDRITPTGRVAVAAVDNKPFVCADGFHLDFRAKRVIVVVDIDVDQRRTDVLNMNAPSVLPSELGSAGKWPKGVIMMAVIAAFVPQVVAGNPCEGLSCLSHTDCKASVGAIDSNGQGGNAGEEEIELGHDR